MLRSASLTLLSVFIAGLAIGSLSTQVRANLQGSGVFPDVPAGTYYDDAIGEMYSKGIITGYSDGRFGPNDNVTRGQIAVIMQRFMEQVGGGTVSSKSSSSASSVKSSSSSSAAENTRGAFRFTIDEFSVSESSRDASVTVVRTSGNTGAVSVEYETADGSAIAGEDYTAYSGRLDFADGESTKNISITITNDEDSEGPESFTVSLKNPTGGSEVTTPDTVTITILDNDASASSSSSQAATENGALEFSASAYTIAESAGSLTVQVRRVSGSTGEVSVGYQTVDGTAKSGSEYESVNGTLTFPAGNLVQTFVVNVLDNSSKQGNKVFTITLKNPTGGAVIYSNEVKVTVADDETVSTGSGSLKFDDNEYVVLEGETAVVVVKRIGGSTGEISADYSTTNGTAKSGFDYTSTSGTITFKQGESEKTILIPIADDTLNDPNEAFSISLTKGSHSVTLATPSTATITISE